MMREKLKRLMAAVVVVMGLVVPVASVAVSTPVMAETVDTNLFGPVEVDTNLFGPVEVDERGSGIKRLLSLVVTVLLYGIGAAGVVGVVIAGIMYLTARDNEAQVAKAKKYLFEIVLGLIAWAMLWTVLNWLIPSFTGFGD